MLKRALLLAILALFLTDATHPGDLRVEQVVELGRLRYTNWLGTLSEKDHRTVQLVLEQMNVVPLAGRSFGELSDGERQKVMVARSLAQEPVVMILDEPTAFLDWPNRVDLLVNLKQIASEEDRAILISSHDLELVLQVADELWMLND
jgi:iron complex transport system ATP-binding protein